MNIKFRLNWRTLSEAVVAAPTAPGIYFMGAHRYVAHDGGLFAEDKFAMQAVKSPTEKELLTRLIAQLEADKELRVYTRQIGLAKKRLAELSR